MQSQSGCENKKLVKTCKQKAQQKRKCFIFAAESLYSFTLILTLKKEKVMKKILFAVAAVAFTFASCGNKTQAPVEAAVDSTEVVAQEANAAADEAVANLTELLNGKDVNKFQEALDAIKAKAAELVALNPEIAKEYVAKVQNFLKENADKVKAFVGDNAAVNAAVSALTAVSADEVVSGFMSAVGDAATNAAEGAKEAVDGAVENAKDEAVKDAKEKGAAAIDDVAAAAKKKLGL